MIGFEPRLSGAGSDHPADGSTATAQVYKCSPVVAHEAIKSICN